MNTAYLYCTYIASASVVFIRLFAVSVRYDRASSQPCQLSAFMHSHMATQTVIYLSTLIFFVPLTRPNIILHSRT
ncbi:hypothetical protein BJY52DRAFT_582620 [Lactarius psammicola]|nr:hypothetical protein BJY52DRAFT_582620 [Lactarius psammicola]